MKGLIVCCLGAAALLIAAAPASAQGRKLSDAELDRVSAGSAGGPSVQVPKTDTKLPFQGEAGNTQAVIRNGFRLAKEGSTPTSSNLITGKGGATFNFQGQAGSTHMVDGNGTISFNAVPIPGATSNLILQGEAQQNLRSLINIAAVNSKIDVLVNLNVNINSTVGTVGQANSLLGH